MESSFSCVTGIGGAACFELPPTGGLGLVRAVLEAGAPRSKMISFVSRKLRKRSSAIDLSVAPASVRFS